ncbi:MAG: DUF3098 domain-containing protein [Bacteroidaceae bacterium]|nr:DUF3098 domain-containing protein [Bacteroidaceae bacterium]
MNNFAFSKINYILLAMGMAIVIIGLILMAGEGSHEGVFNADIFSARRIKVAPLVSLAGFVFIMIAIMYKSKAERKNAENKEN